MISKLFSLPKQQAQQELDALKFLYILLQIKETQDNKMSNE